MQIKIVYDDFNKKLSCSVKSDGNFVVYPDFDCSKEDIIGTAIYEYLGDRFEEMELNVCREWSNGDSHITSGMVLLSMGEKAMDLGAEAFRLADLLDLVLPETYMKPESISRTVKHGNAPITSECVPIIIHNCYHYYFLKSPSAIRCHCQDIIEVLRKQYRLKDTPLVFINKIGESLGCVSDLDILLYRYLRDFIDRKAIIERIQQDIERIEEHAEVDTDKNYASELQMLKAVLESANHLDAA